MEKWTMEPFADSLLYERAYYELRWSVYNLPETPAGIYRSCEHECFGSLWYLKLNLKNSVEGGKTAEFALCFDVSQDFIAHRYIGSNAWMLKLEVRSTGSRPLNARNRFALMQWRDSILLRGQELQDLMTKLDRDHVLEVTCYRMELETEETMRFRWTGELVGESTQTPLKRKRTISCLESLSEDFSKLLDEDSSRRDAEIKCGDNTLRVHRNVLSARSRVFAMMLQGDVTEDRAGLIEIQDMNRRTLEHFVRFLYTGKLPELTVDTARDFLEFGNKYQVDSLINYCSQYLNDNSQKIPRL